MKTLNRSVGIILQVIPFQDHHRIVTFYTPEWGMIKLIVKFAHSKKNAVPLDPLNLIEVVFKQGKNDLHTVVSTTILDVQLKLREDYATLHTAMEMLAALLKSQMPQKSSPVLFSLLLYYLNYLPLSSSKKAFSTSFRLKILRHDGLMVVKHLCSACNIPFKEGGVERGEFFCETHLSSDSVRFSEEEMSSLHELTLSRSLTHLNQTSVSPAFETKITHMFDTLIG